jgi:uncharacterized protein YcnI
MTRPTHGAARRRALRVAALAVVASLLFAASASAHARVSPAVSLSGKLQLYSLAVPTEKSNLTTRTIVMTVPQGIGIDSFVPPPAGSGDNAVVTKVTWTGGHTPTGEDSLFQFLAQPAADKTYVFDIQQTYSNGSIVDWDGSEDSAAPAPSIQAVASMSGGGTSTLTIVALVVGAVGFLFGGFALVERGRRPIA